MVQTLKGKTEIVSINRARALAVWMVMSSKEIKKKMTVTFPLSHTVSLPTRQIQKLGRPETLNENALLTAQYQFRTCRAPSSS